MTTIGVATPSLRYTDRAAYAQWIASSSNGRLSVEDVTKQNDEADLLQLSGAETTAAHARGEGIILGLSKGNVSVQLNMRDQAHPEDYNVQLSKSPDGTSDPLNALDVDFVVDNQEKLYGHDLKNIAYYAEYLQKTMASATQQDPNYVFNGSWGPDRVTHDVNEYVGWLYQKAGIDQPASTTDVKDGFNDSLEGVQAYDPAVLAEAQRRLDAAPQPKTGSTLIKLDSAATPETDKADTAEQQAAVKTPSIAELKAQLIAALTSGGATNVLLDRVHRMTQQLDTQNDPESSGSQTRWA